MSYLGYVVAAYAVFAVVMAWDFVSPQLQIRRELRAARRRAARQAAARATTPAPNSVPDELTR
ncbi:heme exporter protein CcmD [Lysobacter arseniciresistens ZS79]|uniref:Heme exporter protein D n=1 Tax=Lysobacter arseniciresistens ZS79 TaxID=913325 RepID=A0A0A0F4E0_9GAMM|nr:heme exporter protein CcmD [Lysobacter arseniciresistens]KGM57243.1 heme exporter protein CcmD [Lysobacter arseniciresistens ZS79]